MRRRRRLSRKSEAEVVGSRSPPLMCGFGEVGDMMDEW